MLATFNDLHDLKHVCFMLIFKNIEGVNLAVNSLRSSSVFNSLIPVFTHGLTDLNSAKIQNAVNTDQCLQSVMTPNSLLICFLGGLCAKDGEGV